MEKRKVSVKSSRNDNNAPLADTFLARNARTLVPGWKMRVYWHGRFVHVTPPKIVASVSSPHGKMSKNSDLFDFVKFRHILRYFNGAHSPSASFSSTQPRGKPNNSVYVEDSINIACISSQLSINYIADLEEWLIVGVEHRLEFEVSGSVTCKCWITQRAASSE